MNASKSSPAALVEARSNNRLGVALGAAMLCAPMPRRIGNARRNRRHFAQLSRAQRAAGRRAADCQRYYLTAALLRTCSMWSNWRMLMSAPSSSPIDTSAIDNAATACSETDCTALRWQKPMRCAAPR